MKWLLAAVLFSGLAGLHANQCPGSQEKCATGMTCCELPSGHQGCCPYANATCCPDRVHCCPLGSTCSTKGGGHCHDTPDFKKIVRHVNTNHSAEPEALPEFRNSSQIKTAVRDTCGDGSICPGESTCCPIGQGNFACCPMASAVCCPDKKHCCGHGLLCMDGGCVPGYPTHPFQQMGYKKIKKQAIGVNGVCPGGSGVVCPGDATCCEGGQGLWECCPLPNAVCCPDHQTCCPAGYTCSSSQGCTKQD